MRDLCRFDGCFFLVLGSLTTPPCTEGVQWYVLQQAITVSAQQKAAFTRLFENARPTQAVNSRRVVNSVKWPEEQEEDIPTEQVVSLSAFRVVSVLLGLSVIALLASGIYIYYRMPSGSEPSSVRSPLRGYGSLQQHEMI